MFFSIFHPRRTYSPGNNNVVQNLLNCLVKRKEELSMMTKCLDIRIYHKGNILQFPPKTKQTCISFLVVP